MIYTMAHDYAAQMIMIMVFMAAVSVALPLYFRRQIGWTFTLSWMFFLLHCVWFGFNPWFTSSGLSAGVVFKLVLSVKENWILLAALPSLILLISDRNCAQLFRWLFIFFAVDAVYIIFGSGRGLMDAGNFDAAVMACVVPALFTMIDKKSYTDWLGIILLCIPIIFIKGESSKACLLIWAAAYYFSQGRWKIWVPIVAAGIAALVLIPEASNLSNRELLWSGAIKWLYGSDRLWSGVGLGGTSAILPLFKSMPYRAYLMHNDYVQILFDTGVLGLLFFLAVVLKTLWGLRRIPNMFASAVAFSALMLTYHPTHFIVPAIYLLIIVRISAMWRNNGTTI